MHEAVPAMWRATPPVVWPPPPDLMSFSALQEIESCPRRWSLRSADFPVWDRPGYPEFPQFAAMEGTVVHASVETIARALTAQECPSVTQASAIAVLRGLGGFSEVVKEEIKVVLGRFKHNPRARPHLDSVRRKLLSRVPDLRTRVQTFLSRLHVEPSQVQPSQMVAMSSEKRRETYAGRGRLHEGSHSEVELRAPEIGWRGVADFIAVSADVCEIRDFKTGAPKDEHGFQLHVYAVLWWLDRDRNPTARPADRLVISYDSVDIPVPVPGPDQLVSVKTELAERASTARSALDASPPEALPIEENCRHCGVRHLCEEYWHMAGKQSDRTEEGRFTDVQLRIVGRHGPTSWDAVVEQCNGLRAGETILLRTLGLPFDPQTGQHLRVLNAHVAAPSDDPTEDDLPPAIATMSSASESFVVQV